MDINKSLVEDMKPKKDSGVVVANIDQVLKSFE